MELSELSPDELLVLVGLIKLFVHADRAVSKQERTVLRELQAQLGRPRWNEAVHTAKDAFPTVLRLESRARRIRRAGAQHAIHAALMRLAGSERLIEDESHVLQWVADEWGLSEDEPGGESFESFVILDD